MKFILTLCIEIHHKYVKLHFDSTELKLLTQNSIAIFFVLFIIKIERCSTDIIGIDARDINGISMKKKRSNKNSEIFRIDANVNINVKIVYDYDL